MKCSRCGNVSLKSTFREDKKSKGGFFSQFQSSILQKQKVFVSEIREKLEKFLKKQYIKNRYETDITFIPFQNTRHRIHHALNGKSKSSSTKDGFGIDIVNYRKWIEYQITTEVNWSNREIDHLKPIFSFEVSDKDELQEASC